MLERVDQIDFNELYILLFDATRKAFRFAQENHPDETFYAFGFYYSQSWGFIIPTCNTEEAHMQLGDLKESERENQLLEWFYARWYPRLWRYHALGHDYFTPVKEWLHNNLKGYNKLSSDHALLRINIHHRMIDTCLKVLKVLDQEKFFGQSSIREHIVLNVMNADYVMNIGDAVYKDSSEYVRYLNPTSTYKRWRFEREMQGHAFSVLIPARFDRKSK